MFTANYPIYFFGFSFFLFFIKSFVFIIFISFLEEVSNFRNRILTNQKPEYQSILLASSVFPNNE